MRGLVTVGLREITERRSLLVAAAVASFVPLAVPFVPSLGRLGPADVRLAVATMMAVGIAVVLALFLGSTIVGRDLAENRMGFYFARPLSAAAIWWGKLGTAFLLVLICELIVLLPTALVSGRAREVLLLGWPELEWAVLQWIGPLAVLLVAHAAGVAWRARSAWLVLDAGAMLALAAAILWTARPFLQVQAIGVIRAGLTLLLAASLLALAAAGAVQVAVGRVDLRRGHRALSLTLWGTGAAAVVALAAWGHWVRAADPADIFAVGTLSLGSGDWMAISGPSSGRVDYRPRFLLNVVTGSSLPIGSETQRWWRGDHVVFSEDGQWAAWLENVGSSTWRVVRAKLQGARPERKPTVLELRESSLAAISPGGARVAIRGCQALSVYDADSGSLLAAAPLPEDAWSVEAHFLTDDRLRVLSFSMRQAGEHDLLLGELDVAARRFERIGRLERSAWTSHLVFDLDHDLIILSRRPDDVWSSFLYDAGSATLIANLGPSRPAAAAVLADGRPVRVMTVDSAAWLEVFAPDGTRLARHSLGTGSTAWLGGEAEPGRVIVSLLQSEQATWPWTEDRTRTVIVDVESGELVELQATGIPALSTLGARLSPGARRPGAPATRLFLGPERVLRLLNPRANTVRQLVPAPH